MRNRAYRRAQTRRVIARREAIVRNVYQFVPAETHIWAGHRLDKGKVHCSCQLCSVKTNPRRCKLNGGWKHSDKKRLLRGADEAPFYLVSSWFFLRPRLDVAGAPFPSYFLTSLAFILLPANSQLRVSPCGASKFTFNALEVIGCAENTRHTLNLSWI